MSCYNETRLQSPWLKLVGAGGGGARFGSSPQAPKRNPVELVKITQLQNKRSEPREKGRKDLL